MLQSLILGRFSLIICLLFRLDRSSKKSESSPFRSFNEFNNVIIIFYLGGTVWKMQIYEFSNFYRTLHSSVQIIS